MSKLRAFNMIGIISKVDLDFMIDSSFEGGIFFTSEAIYKGNMFTNIVCLFCR